MLLWLEGICLLPAHTPAASPDTGILHPFSGSAQSSESSGVGVLPGILVAAPEEEGGASGDFGPLPTVGMDLILFSAPALGIYSVYPDGQLIS